MNIANKIRQTATRIRGWLACILTACLILAPVPALAASQSYAITCINSSISNTDVPQGYFAFCPDSNSKVVIEGVGHPNKPYPKSAAVATVSVDCSGSSPVSPNVGALASTIQCKNGSKPTFKSFKVVQSYTAKSPSPAPAPPPGPSSSCNAKNCDLIATYINPAINLLSVVFGLIAVISLLLGAIQFAASEGDPQKASKAKNRISNTIIAIVVYSLFYGFVQFLVPGGLFQ